MTDHDAQVIFYALLVGAMAFCAWLSFERVIQVLALIIVAEWAASNLALAVFGYIGEPLVVPTIDAVAAISTAMVGYRHKTRLALMIFGLFVVLGAVHVLAFAANQTSTVGYYFAKNVLFIAQAVLVGGAGVRGFMVARLSGRYQRARSHRSRRA